MSEAFRPGREPLARDGSGGPAQVSASSARSEEVRPAAEPHSAMQCPGKQAGHSGQPDEAPRNQQRTRNNMM